MFDTATGGDPLIARAGIRTVGNSLLISNLSPEATRGGFIHTARVKGSMWYDYSLSSLTNARGYRSDLPGATGVYTFVIPEDDRQRFTVVNPIETKVASSTYDASMTGFIGPRIELDILPRVYVHYILYTPTTPLLATVADSLAGTVAPLILRLTTDFSSSSKPLRGGTPPGYQRTASLIWSML
jgi:hypothetical protein